MLYKFPHELNTKRQSPLIAVVMFASSNKSFLFCGLYAVFVFAGQHLMRERQKLNLRRPLVLWSLSLAIFRWDMIRSFHFLCHRLCVSRQKNKTRSLKASMANMDVTTYFHLWCVPSAASWELWGQASTWWMSSIPRASGAQCVTTASTAPPSASSGPTHLSWAKPQSWVSSLLSEN